MKTERNFYARYFHFALWTGLIGVLTYQPPAMAASQLVFNATQEMVTPRVTTAEVKALQALYKRKGLGICKDFKVNLRQNGRFTQETKQTLYLVQNCYSDVAVNPMREKYTNDLLILNGTQLVYFEKGFTDELAILPALGNTSLNTLLKQVWFGPHMGEFARFGTLLKFSAGKFRDHAFLGPLYRDIDSYDAKTDKVNGSSSRRILEFDPAQKLMLRMLEYTQSFQGPSDGSFHFKYASKTLDTVIKWDKPPVNVDWQN